MKQENQLNRLLDGVISNIDINANDLKKKDFIYLEKKIDDFLKAVSDISTGIKFQKFRTDLQTIRSRTVKTEKELEKLDINKEIDHLRDTIKQRITSFRTEQQEIDQIRKKVFEDFTGKLNKLTENIKLDFEFLFDRYSRRVSLNIGSKFFELIKLEDDFEIRNFLFENVFTINRLTNDLVELGHTFNGQIRKLIDKLPLETGIEFYNKLPELKITTKGFDLTKITADLRDQVSNKEIFQANTELIREVLSTILFSGISAEQSIYNVLQQRDSVNKLSDHKIKKYMKRMEQQLKEFIIKLDREIDTRIEDMIYPVRSYFTRIQDKIITIALCNCEQQEELNKRLEDLTNEIMFKQDKSNYQLFKEILS